MAICNVGIDNLLLAKEEIIKRCRKRWNQGANNNNTRTALEP